MNFIKKIALLLMGLSSGAVAALIPSYIEASDPTWEQIVPFSAERLWLMKQARTIIEAYQVDGVAKPVDEQKQTYGALRGLVESFGDPYTRFVTPEDLDEEQMNLAGKYGGIGLVVSQRDGEIVAVSPIDNTPAEQAGFRPKDQIVKVDDEVVVGKPLNTVVKMLRGKPGSSVVVWVRRKGIDDLLEMKMVRELIKLDSVRSELLSDNVGYIRLSQFITSTSADVKKAIEDLKKKKARGYVIDLRNNGGGLLTAATEICDFFLNDGPIVETRGRVSKANDAIDATKGILTSDPVVILVNDGSASGSEIVAGALRDRKRAVLMGTKSFGKGSVQTLFTLSDGSGLYVTIAKYYTPSGDVIDHVGLTPEIVVEADTEKIEPKKENTSEKPLSAAEQKKVDEKRRRELMEKDIQLKKAREVLTRLIAGESRESVVHLVKDVHLSGDAALKGQETGTSAGMAVEELMKDKKQSENQSQDDGKKKP